MNKHMRSGLSILASLICYTSFSGSLFGDQHQSVGDGGSGNVLAVIGGSHIDRRHIGSFFSDDAEIEETFTVESSVGTPHVTEIEPTEIAEQIEGPRIRILRGGDEAVDRRVRRRRTREIDQIGPRDPRSRHRPSVDFVAVNLRDH